MDFACASLFEFKMESFYATNAFRSAPKIQAMSTLESDDASEFSHPSLSSRFDSGICSLTDCSSFRSGLSSFGAPSKIFDPTASLEEQLKRMALAEHGASSAPGVNCSSVYTSDYYSLSGEASGSPVQVEERTPMVEVEQTLLWNPVDPNSGSADLFQQDEDGDTSLHLAIIKPDPSLAIQIIEMGQFTERLDIQNDHQQTPLHLAVITDQPHLVRALVVSGASLMARDKHGNTPLHLACKLGYAQCVERLTAPPSFEEGTYIWNESQRKGLQSQTMNYGRFTSGDVSLLNYEGDTCLHLAMSSVAEAKISILNYLLTICGADVNAQEGKCGFSLLHQAVRSRDLETVKFLLVQPNILVNQCCYNGYTPLDFALSQHQIQLAQVLHSVGAVSFTNNSAPESTEVSQDEDFDDLVIGCFQR